MRKIAALAAGLLIHGAALRLKHPDYCPSYDMDADAARQSRLRILRICAREPSHDVWYAPACAGFCSIQQ